MKRHTILYRSLLLTLGMIAVSVAAHARPDTLWSKANDLYTQGQYQDAKTNYLALIEAQHSNVDVLYNLANTYYKLNDVPHAILYYERALRLDPDNDDIRYNLSIAQQQTIDKIEAMPRFFVLRWCEAIKQWAPINTWSILSLGLLVAAGVLMLIALLGYQPWRRKLAFFASLLAIFLSLGTLYTAYSANRDFENHNTAIIFTPVVSIKASPDNAGVDLFILHEGTKVHVIDQLGLWLKIKTADGNQGWLASNAVEII